MASSVRVRVSDEILTAQDLAAEWGLAAHSIRKMMRRGDIPGAFKVGQEWRIRRSAVRSYEETRTADAIPPTPPRRGPGRPRKHEVAR